MKIWNKIRKVFGDVLYRYGMGLTTKLDMVEKQNFIGNWITVYETDNEDDWNKACNSVYNKLEFIKK